ncbi:MAG: pyridoxamine 5'-phosphate oxidase family protein, partial [Candidatus Tectomicrobia bacterium]|nr:pyridoxamine 5'-phosphate oxidase family protein [Candidatus Tectomicrobia bacterium]
MARVCTVNRDGSPHVVPLVYKFHPEEGTFFLSTGADSVTVHNLRRSSALSICIDDDEYPFRAVVVEGEA